MSLQLHLGISPCPNDTYIYEGLIAGLPNSRIKWRVGFADVQTLNEMVRRSELDVAKVSCGVVPSIAKDYEVLSCGGAVGYSCGPLLLSSNSESFLPAFSVALPGRDTTAALLFRFWASRELPKMPAETFALFNEVYSNLLAKKFAQGVVIHEHRFTWERDGLSLIQDLGEYWEAHTGIPVPLGCAVIKKSLASHITEVEAEIRESIKIARSRAEIVTPFIRSKAQISSDEVIEKHIKTFVTDFSFDMGESGRLALKKLLEFANS